MTRSELKTDDKILFSRMNTINRKFGPLSIVRFIGFIMVFAADMYISSCETNQETIREALFTFRTISLTKGNRYMNDFGNIWTFQIPQLLPSATGDVVGHLKRCISPSISDTLGEANCRHARQRVHFGS